MREYTFKGVMIRGHEYVYVVKVAAVNRPHAIELLLLRYPGQTVSYTNCFVSGSLPVHYRGSVLVVEYDPDATGEYTPLT